MMAAWWQHCCAVVSLCLVGLRLSSAQVLFSCNLEFDFCRMVQARDDSRATQVPSGSFDWLRYSGRTPTGLSAGGTGPDGGYGGTRYYMYIETSDPQQAQDEARITTPTLPYSGQVCVEFYYNMYGGNIGRLDLYTESGAGFNRRTAWTVSGNQGNKWMEARTTVDLFGTDQRVGWRGVRGNDFRGDIAVDEITIMAGSCSDTDGGQVVPDIPEEQDSTPSAREYITITTTPEVTSSSELSSIDSTPSAREYITITTTPEVTSSSELLSIDSTPSASGYITTTTTPEVTSSSKLSSIVNLPYACNFEYDWCNMQQRRDDQFDWIRFTGATPTAQTGPNAAPSPGTWYMYIETSDPRQFGDMASIETPEFVQSGDACVKFNYHMYGENIRELQLYTSRRGRSTPWQRWQFDQGNVWRSASVDVRLENNDRVGFSGVRGDNIRGDIAVDNISIEPRRCGSTPPPTPDNRIPWSCSFEMDFCTMTQSVNDQFDWQRGNLPTETANTGPRSGAVGTIWYLYAEGSDPRRYGDRARIETQSFNYNGDTCLTFYYHMYGNEMGRLLVYTAYDTVSRPLFDEAENHGNRWIQARLNVQMRSGDRIIFESTRGRGYRSDMAIDEIRIDPGYCSGGEEPGPAPSSQTPTPTTESPSGFVTPRPPDFVNNYFSCEFETSVSSTQSNCRIRQATDDTFDWTRMSGRTPTGVLFDRRLENNLRYPVTGPDGAQQGMWYVYIEASGRRDGDMARLILEGNDFLGSGMYCLRFYYSMNGYHSGSLDVFTRQGGGPRRDRWSMMGDQLDGWKKAAVELDMTGVSEVGIEAVTRGKFSGDIAIDDIRMTPGPCVSTPQGLLWICTFEVNDGSSTFCDMEQDTSDTFRFDWTLWRGPTASEVTGPNRAYNGEYYIYIEASKPRQPGDQARILFPSINYNGDICVEFMYNMYGYHIGTLSLFRRRSGFDQDQWSITGQQGTQWMERRQTITNLSPGERIGFRGVRGGEYSGDIALDNIRVRPGRC